MSALVELIGTIWTSFFPNIGDPVAGSLARGLELTWESLCVLISGGAESRVREEPGEWTLELWDTESGSREEEEKEEERLADRGGGTKCCFEFTPTPSEPLSLLAVL